MVHRLTRRRARWHRVSCLEHEQGRGGIALALRCSVTVVTFRCVLWTDVAQQTALGGAQRESESAWPVRRAGATYDTDTAFVQRVARNQKSCPKRKSPPFFSAPRVASPPLCLLSSLTVERAPPPSPAVSTVCAYRDAVHSSLAVIAPCPEGTLAVFTAPVAREPVCQAHCISALLAVPPGDLSHLLPPLVTLPARFASQLHSIPMSTLSSPRDVAALCLLHANSKSFVKRWQAHSPFLSCARDAAARAHCMRCAHWPALCPPHRSECRRFFLLIYEIVPLCLCAVAVTSARPNLRTSVASVFVLVAFCS